MKRKRCSSLLRVTGLLTLALCLATAAVAEDGPFKVQWPEGWEVTRVPPPAPKEENFGIERIRAEKLEGGNPVILQLAYYHRKDRGNSSLEEELDGLLQEAERGFQSFGLTPTVVSRKAGTLASHPALEAEVSATNETVSMQFWASIAISREYVYSLSFTGLGDAFERNRGALEATVRSLVLKEGAPSAEGAPGE